MSRIVLPNPVNNKRLITRLDSTHDILFYGLNNLYPQEQEQLRLRSPLIKSATALLEDFINGRGWELNSATIVNGLDDTVGDVLNLVARDYALFNGFALHINYDGLGKITGIQQSLLSFAECQYLTRWAECMKLLLVITGSAIVTSLSQEES